jgi:hypothetical protein
MCHRRSVGIPGITYGILKSNEVPAGPGQLLFFSPLGSDSPRLPLSNYRIPFAHDFQHDSPRFGHRPAGDEVPVGTFPRLQRKAEAAMFWTIFAILCIVYGLFGFAAGACWHERPSISVLVGSVCALSLGLLLHLVEFGEVVVAAFMSIWPLVGSWLGVYWREIGFVAGDLDFGWDKISVGKERRARRTH